MLTHESEKAQLDQRITDMKHQLDEQKSQVNRLQMNLEAKEQHIGRLQTENRTNRRNYMQAQKTTESTYGGVVGASMLGKLGVAGLGAGAGNAGAGAGATGLGAGAGTQLQGGGGGYQPRMFGAGRTNATGNEGLSDQSANSGYNQRSSYATRFGANPQSNNLGASS